MKILYLIQAFHLFFFPVHVTCQSQVPEYDFWDDSVFDDLKKTKYRGFQRDILNGTSADACVNACLGQASCVSLFYNPRTAVCERVAINVLLNSQFDDDTIKFAQNNRYYRYLPLGTAFCPLESCFYYDRKARACWKVLWSKGPHSRGRYTYNDAVQACINEGGQIASLDTWDKLNQINLMLQNLPFAVIKNLGWRWFHIGARRKNVGSPAVWKNGQPVSNNSRFFVADYTHNLRNPNYLCMVLAGNVPAGATVEDSYRLNYFTCTVLRPGTVCEIPLPPALSGSGK